MIRRGAPNTFAHLHRRDYAIAADPPGAALQSAIGLLDRDDEDLGARLDVALIARHVSHDRRIGGNGDLLFSVLVFQRQRPTIDALTICSTLALVIVLCGRRSPG